MHDLAIFISQHLMLSYTFAIILVLLLIVETLRANRSKVRINTARAVQLINREHAVIIDTRPADAFKQGHLIEAISFASQSPEQKKKLERFKHKPLIVICQNGSDSQKVAATLIKEGYNAYILAGGIQAWRDAGLPIIKDI